MQFLPMTDIWPRHKNAVDLREILSEEKAGIQTMRAGHAAAREAAILRGVPGCAGASAS